MKLASCVDAADLGLTLLAWRADSRQGRDDALRRGIGDLSYLARRGMRRNVLARLTAALGSALTAGELRRLARATFRTSWLEREIYWMRLLASEPNPIGRIRELVTVNGLESLREALAAGRGVVLWESPLGNRALGRLAVSAAGFRVIAVHGPKHGGSLSRIGQGLVRGLHRSAEARLPVEVVDIDENSTGYLDLLVDHLRRNGVVCINGFGRLGRRSMTLEFLGESRSFATGSVSMAISTGAALIPAICYRDSSGQRHVTLERPCPTGGGESLGASQARALRYCLEVLESYLLRYPDQWTGWHETGSAARQTRP